MTHAHTGPAGFTPSKQTEKSENSLEEAKNSGSPAGERASERARERERERERERRAPEVEGPADTSPIVPPFSIFFFLNPAVIGRAHAGILNGRALLSFSRNEAAQSPVAAAQESSNDKSPDGHQWLSSEPTSPTNSLSAETSDVTSVPDIEPADNLAEAEDKFTGMRLILGSSDQSDLKESLGLVRVYTMCFS